MKTSTLLSLSLVLCALAARAAVIVTPGRIEIHAALEGDGTLLISTGETLDYLTFEVTIPTSVRLIGTNLDGSIFLALGEIVGGGEPFDGLLAPNVLFGTGNVDPPEFTKLLSPGLYVIQVAVDEYEDLGPDFIPVSDTDAIIAIDPYSFVLEGNVRGLQFLEGNRDRTFTVTQIVPEPSTCTLLALAMAVRLGASKRSRAVRAAGGEAPSDKLV